MDEYNMLISMSQDIPAISSIELRTKLLSDYLHNVVKSNIYSYLVYKKYTQNEFVGWKIKYQISQNKNYNTLTIENVILEVLTIITKPSLDKQEIIGYKQPDIALMLELFDPLMRRLAIEQSNKWTKLEYDDAYAMCQICMLELYKQGYYIHKDILKKSFKNKVLMYLRPYKYEPDIVSFEGLAFNDSSGDDAATSVSDIFVNKEEIYAQEDKEALEEILQLFSKLKDFCIDIMGERQFEQLYKEYSNHHTTTWSRKKLQDLKKKLAKRGITIKTFKE